MFNKCAYAASKGRKCENIMPLKKEKEKRRKKGRRE